MKKASKIKIFIKKAALLGVSFFTAIKKASKRKHFWKNMLLLGAGVFILLTGILVLWLASLRIPDFNSFQDRKVLNSTKIYDRTGEILLFDIHRDTKRTDIVYQDMGVNIRNATVAIEDSEFYNHRGVGFRRTAPARFSDPTPRRA